VKPFLPQAKRSAQCICRDQVDSSLDRCIAFGNLQAFTKTPVAQKAFVGNSAGENAPRHLDPMSHRGEYLSAGAGSASLGRENLAPKVGKCLVREQLCAHRQSIRHANPGAGVQPDGVRIEDRKRV
jgi:hypothetical protein